MTKHVAIHQLLQTEILRLPAHSQLAGERELAVRFEVSRMTLRKAIDALVASGHLYRIAGGGTFVADLTITKGSEITSFTEDMAARGMRPSSLVVDAATEPASAAVADDLRIGLRTRVHRIERVRLADGVPMALEQVYILAMAAEGLLDHPLDGSLYEVLRGYGVELVRAQRAIRATVLSDDEAVRLAVPPGSAALSVHTIAFTDRGRPVESAHTLYRGDRYTLTIDGISRPTTRLNIG